MPQLIDNRIYLDPTKEFYSEQNKAIELKLNHKNCPIIIVEEKLESNSRYQIQVEGNNLENRHLILRYWMAFFNIKQASAEYIGLGTWNNPTLDDEIRSLFTIIEEEKYSNQTEFIIERNEKLINYIVKKFEENVESLSWFNFSFFSDLDEKKYQFISSHFGTEIYCFDLTNEQVEVLLANLDGNNLFIRVSKDEK
ncbi:hypothetical protein [Oceanirhabdus sp. W0125-5]|uniref:hypothetical protein n=1 Tax=Oceanirhabdus sp. W0125-5 TaxID=2999116 RepID=UPI0022F34958|nr:hypothetical protein [Oceanirhabdus sp. W0125-5]WBW95196.1 hypothetical protein OW730_16045 [Oceanirhabdus sp. W0125-5]